MFKTHAIPCAATVVSIFKSKQTCRQPSACLSFNDSSVILASLPSCVRITALCEIFTLTPKGILYSTSHVSICLFPGVSLGRAIFLGLIQSHVSHALHRIRKVSTPKSNRHVVDHVVHDQWCYLLCNVPWTCHKPHSEPGLFKEAIQRKGTIAREKLYDEIMAIVVQCTAVFYSGFLPLAKSQYLTIASGSNE